MTFVTVPLHVSHKKEIFNCGKTILDNYIHKQAKQDVKRMLCACFVLNDGNTVKGYYTLSGTSIARNIIPDEIIKKFPPSYTSLPATLLGRLAVDNAYKGQGLGKLILIDALKRSYENSITSVGSIAVIVDPLDEDAITFYKQYGFILLPDSGKMFLPMDTISGLF